MTNKDLDFTKDNDYKDFFEDDFLSDESDNLDDDLFANDDDDDFISESSSYEEDEADVAFDAKEKKKKRSKIISRIILVAAACVFIFAAYNLITILLGYKQGRDIYNSIGDQVLEDKPVTITINEDEQDVEVPFTYNHQALLDINTDGLGFLYIPSINIRLPIAQTTDNDYYLHHTFNKTWNDCGCLFVDYRITGGISANHLIIYGHNMNDGSMFGKLSRYQSYSWYRSEGYDRFYIYTGDVIREYKIFTVYVTDPISDTFTFNFSSASALRDYAERVSEQSIYDTGVDVSDATQIVTFSTCTGDSTQRLIVSGTYVGQAKISDAETGTTAAN